MAEEKKTSTAEEKKTSFEDLFGKGIGIVVALGALAVGVAAAILNNERTQQMRQEVQGRLDDLGKRVDELSAQAARALEERKPDIEETIERSRKAVAEGLDRAREVVEQGAERAQSYVNRAGEKTAASTNGSHDDRPEV